MPITDLSIKSATTGTLWDDTLKGFGVRVGKSSKTFIVLIESGRRKKIGRYPVISLAKARSEAKRILAEKALGKIHPTHTAFEDARDAFLKDCSHLRPLTRNLYRRHCTVHFPFGRKALADITPADILSRLKGLKPSEKEHAFRIGRRFFKWCVAQHLIDRSPFERLEAPPNGKARERVLTEEELKAVYRASLRLKNSFYGLVALLVHTGQRQGEISRLKWEHLSDAITLPKELTKNGRQHRFPIGPGTVQFLARLPRNSSYVFPSKRTESHITGFSEAKRDFDRECGVIGWTLHDLRRTYATGLQKLGIRLEVIEALLNHISGTRAGIVGVYQRYDYWPEMTDAVAKWEQYLSTLLTGTLPVA